MRETEGLILAMEPELDRLKRKDELRRLSVSFGIVLFFFFGLNLLLE